jgi:hypothetical protein
MNLKEYLPKVPFLTKDQEVREYYFALNIGNDTVEASVWGIEGKNLQIISLAKSTYSSPEELIQSSNMALDEALGAFQPEPTQILFGVPDSWLQDDNLKEEQGALLKKMVKELDVSPMAYVSTTHALTHLLQKLSGVPATTILVGVGDPVIVTVVKAGKITGTKVSKRGENLAEDLERVLMSFTGLEVLPSKISLYGSDSSKLDKLKDELTSYNWMANLPFLHLPKVEILEDDISIKAISLAGASEIDPEVVYQPQKVSSTDSIKESSNLSPVISAGFVTGDIAEESPLDSVEEERPLPAMMEKEMAAVGGAAGNLKSKLLAPFVALKEGRFRMPHSLKDLVANKGMFAPVIVLILLVLAYLFLPKAQVTIFVDPKVLERDAQVIADPKVSSVDEEAKIIPGEIVQTDISGSGKGAATGKKQIGNAAKGSVVIINASDKSQSFSQGTTLTSDQGKKYALDSSVSVASRSADFSPGKSDAIGVSAKEIGPDSNLKSGEFLQVGSVDKNQLKAQVSTDISGGTSQDVTVVTSDDQKKLLAQVLSDLRNQAKDKLQGKLEGDQKILPEALEEKINSTSYSKNINDQAAEFSLNLSAHFTGTAYSDNDLKLMVSKLVQTNVPEGFELRLSDTETQADVSKLEKDGRLIFLARFKAKLLPKLDLEKIKEQIKGQSPSKVIEILKGNDNVVGSDISIRPSLPGPLQRLPFFTKNISVEVSAK